MPLNPAWLPMATPLDLAEEPPGSLDPLGTLNYAERLSGELLPAFTVRMWRARLLTYAAVAATVADRAVGLLGGREDFRLPARLAFERLFVAAIVRQAFRDQSFARALPQLPGRDLATAALRAEEPLTAANFLKGQAVNGPFGVIQRLARDLELIDADGRVGRNATSLLLAWSEDEQLQGVLDEDGPSSRPGAQWLADAVTLTSGCVEKRAWPGPGHRIWEQLAQHLRADHIGKKERRALVDVLEKAQVRSRVLRLLRDQVELFRVARRNGSRGDVERTVLVQGLQPQLGKDPVDRLISDVIVAADSYEQTASLLQQAFEGLIWGLKQWGGRARPEVVIGEQRLKKHLGRTRFALGKTVARLDQAMSLLRNQPSLEPALFVEPLARLREDVVAAERSERALAGAVLDRHARVQREKRKAQWIESEAHWTLMPGENRVPGDAPPDFKGTYLHPFKVTNAYALLGDLGRVRLEDRYVEQ